MIQTGPPIPDDEDVDVKVALLVQRVQAIEQTATLDRTRAKEADKEILSRLHAASQHAAQEAARLEDLVKHAAAGTVRIQIGGLILVGLGTLLGTVGSALS